MPHPSVQRLVVAHDALSGPQRLLLGLGLRLAHPSRRLADLGRAEGTPTRGRSEGKAQPEGGGGGGGGKRVVRKEFVGRAARNVPYLVSFFVFRGEQALPQGLLLLLQL